MSQVRGSVALPSLSLCLALILGACGDRPPSEPGSDASAADSSPPQQDSTVPPGPCPAALPANAAACSPEGLVCQYGSDPRRQCRPQAACTSGAWQITTPKCTAPPAVQCPAQRADAANKACTPKDAYCTYPGDLICHCTDCISYPVPHCSGNPTWHCDVPNTDPGCPPGKANLGQPCSEESKKCTYHCGADGARVCKDKVWTAAMGSPCPISSRRAKRAISYLSPEQAAAITRRTLKVKLATYLYRDPAQGRGRQLGFILEDVGHSYAGDPDEGRVNLYGYTSMLLVTVQAQQRAIDGLRRELRDLRARVRGRAPAQHRKKR